jgi:hypothetical protein
MKAENGLTVVAALMSRHCCFGPRHASAVTTKEKSRTLAALGVTGGAGGDGLVRRLCLLRAEDLCCTQRT